MCFLFCLLAKLKLKKKKKELKTFFLALLFNLFIKGSFMYFIFAEIIERKLLIKHVQLSNNNKKRSELNDEKIIEANLS